MTLAVPALDASNSPGVVAEIAPVAAVAEPTPSHLDQTSIPRIGTSFAQKGTFLILLVAALYFSRDFMLPVLVAFLFALVLRPLVTRAAQIGIPIIVSALLLVAALIGGVAGGAYFLSGPIASWVKDAPDIAHKIDLKLSSLRRPVDAITKAGEQVQAIAGGAAGPGEQKVVLSEPGLLSKVASNVPNSLARIALSLILLLFLLASGDLFYVKMVKVLPTLSDKKTALRIIRDVEHDVSRYFLTITLINAGLGVAVGVSAFAWGLPTPVVWGVVAAVVNFVPYIGPLVGIVLVGAASIVSFDTLTHALGPPATYMLFTFLEGQLLTPIVVGRRLQLNEVAIFIAVAFWGWLWGLVGALIAVPVLVVFKVFSDHIQPLHSVGEFLAARESSNSTDH